MSRSPESKWHENTALDIERWVSCSGVPRGCVNRIRIWSLRRDDHSGVLIGTGGMRRYDWPARV